MNLNFRPDLLSIVHTRGFSSSTQNRMHAIAMKRNTSAQNHADVLTERLVFEQQLCIIFPVYAKRKYALSARTTPCNTHFQMNFHLVFPIILSRSQMLPSLIILLASLCCRFVNGSRAMPSMSRLQRPLFPQTN